jgi:deazaflavin-dependent oxidoreductase (nitroreductase family)
MWYNPIISLLLRTPFHGLISKGVLLLEFKGRKSGKTYRVPVSFARLEDGSLLVITFKRRKWWYNFVGGEQVHVWMRGRKRAARAEAITETQALQAALVEYLKEQRFLARHLEVTFDDEGQPDPEAVARQAEKRVIVCISEIGR